MSDNIKSREAQPQKASLAKAKRLWFGKGLLSGMQPYVPALYTDNTESGYKAMMQELEAHRQNFMVARKPRSNSAVSGIALDWQKIGEDLYNAIGQWEANPKKESTVIRR